MANPAYTGEGAFVTFTNSTPTSNTNLNVEGGEISPNIPRPVLYLQRYFRQPLTHVEIVHEWGFDPLPSNVCTETLDGYPLKLSVIISPTQRGRAFSLYASTPVSFFLSVVGIRPVI